MQSTKAAVRQDDAQQSVCYIYFGIYWEYETYTQHRWSRNVPVNLCLFVKKDAQKSSLYVSFIRNIKKGLMLHNL